MNEMDEKKKAITDEIIRKMSCRYHRVLLREIGYDTDDMDNISRKGKNVLSFFREQYGWDGNFTNGSVQAILAKNFVWYRHMVGVSESHSASRYGYMCLIRAIHEHKELMRFYFI